jgi:uncharacterized phage protein (TIGR01671 family)
MTREIKFRAWDKVDKIMIEWSELRKLHASLSYIEESERLDARIMMQYTGLKDKNGKEIYEGDIVEWKQLNTWHKNNVYWLGSGFYADTSEWKEDLNEPTTISLISALGCEIIGDIYSNPDLLPTKS